MKEFIKGSIMIPIYFIGFIPVIGLLTVRLEQTSLYEKFKNW